MGFTIAMLTAGMSMVAVKSRHLLVTLGASALWATLLAFIIANTTAGTNMQELFLIAIGTFIIAMVLLGAFRARTGQSGNDDEVGSVQRFMHKLNSDSISPRRDTMESAGDYRVRVHSVLRRKKR